MADAEEEVAEVEVQEEVADDTNKVLSKRDYYFAKYKDYGYDDYTHIISMKRI